MVSFSHDVIELRSVQDSGSLFHYERADAISPNDETAPDNQAEVDANISLDEDDSVSSDTIAVSNTTHNSDGTWRYHILDHDWDLKVRIEDFIDGDEVNISEIKKALGYTEGKVRDDNGDVVSFVDKPLYSSPYSTFNFYADLHTDSYINIHIGSTSVPSSRVLHYTYNNNDCYITENQLIIVVYVWGVYGDAQVHENPCAGLLDQYAIRVGDKEAFYEIP